MIHKFSRYIMTLVALFAMTTGAWAQDVTKSTDVNNTWTFTMPDTNVELEPEYFNATAPTANTADIYANSTTPLITAGSTTEEGATMKYAVTTEDVQPTSTDGFSANVPTAEVCPTAGTYYVWYYLDFATADDSDISAQAVEVTVKADPLDVAKTAAKAELDALLNGKNQEDYDAEDWVALTQAIANGKDAIDAATTIEAVNTAKATAIENAPAIKTKAEKLEAAKTAAKAELDALLNGKNQEDYDAADWTALTQAIANGKDAIDAATTIDAVNTALNNAIQNATAIKTKAEKLAEAKEDLGTVINEAELYYNSISDDYADEASTLQTAINTAKGVLNKENVTVKEIADATDDLNAAISDARAAVAQKLKYTITLAEGTEDKANWTIDPTQAKQGTEVKATYSGRLKVKNVEAKLKYPMAAKATAKDKGKLICAAGHIHAYGEDADCTAARVVRIFYVGSETGNVTYSHGLALALTDEDGALTWAAAQNACTEKTAVSEASWILATKPQWEKMTGTNANAYAVLRNSFSAIGGTDMQSATYWSATSPQDADNAYYYNLVNGTWSDDAKSNTHRVRFCLVF